VAARRGKSQARRNTGNGGGSLPGWAWMVLGIVLTVGVILAAPRFLKGNGEDGFFRPRANPDAQPVGSDAADDADVAGAGADDTAITPGARTDTPDQPDYDFYDLLPGEEVAMTDAQLAAAAREEQARAQREQQRLAQQQAAAAQSPGNATQPQPLAESQAPAASVAAAATPAAAVAAGSDTPYVLQAGAFGASGDAEAVKAKIALLGLNARVESAQINGKTVYRVRMGPYGTASELASAKGKLASGGLPALAIKAK
jgi:cell division protein FtsN